MQSGQHAITQETGVPAPKSTLKQTLVNLLAPAMIALVILFWAFGPAALLKNPWTLVVMSSLITITVLLLEVVFERHVGWRMNRREFFTDLFYVVLSSTVIAWTSEKLAENPLKAAKASLGITTEWATHMPWLVQAAMVIFIIEFGQYWMHRLMHNWTPFWLTHAPHHHITQLNAAKGAVGNPIELFLISLSVLAFFDLDQTAMFCAFNVGGVISTFAHANVKSDPPLWYSFFFTTIRHHSFHHSVEYENTRCNYGNSLILLDRIFGTYREGEGVLVGQDERRRLSIWEQTMFPFQPLIDKYKARRTTGGATLDGGSDHDTAGGIAAA
jgi:sterol desaturase/sphingolipid hydroxylase (fatty acid hydroxylase superfamily)